MKEFKDTLEGRWIIPVFLIFLILTTLLMDFMFRILG